MFDVDNRNKYISNIKENDENRCCECGRLIAPNEDSYECRTHKILCENCLKMLHKRYVG